MSERKLILPGGFVTLVDEEDYEYLCQYRWQLQPNRRGKPYVGGWIEGGAVKMHREILSAEKGMQVDHINGDGLDNRRTNLRLVTQAQNCMNRSIGSNNTSGYKGVYAARRGKWSVKVQSGGVLRSYGEFVSKHDAARRYNEVAVSVFGEFAKLNTIEEDK